MNDNISDDRVFLRGATDRLCVALLNGAARYVDNPLQRHARSEIAKLLEDAIAAGQLIYAGPVSTQQIVGPVAVAAMKETKAGLFQLPHLATPIVFSIEARSGGDEWPATLVIVEGLGRKMRLTSLMAVFGPNGEVSLTPTRDLAEAAASSVARRTPGRQSSPEQRKTSEDALNQAAVVLLYLSACKAAVTSAVHNGVAYSKLDVAKALHLKAVEKAADADSTAKADDTRFPTLGEARRALIDASGLEHVAVGANCDETDVQSVRNAVLETKAGRLFVIENLSPDLLMEQQDDAYSAIESGTLRGPFPTTFILVTVESVWGGVYLLGVSEKTSSNGLKHWAVFPARLNDGTIGWLRPPSTRLGEKWSFPDLFPPLAVVVLSLIADARSRRTLVEADAALNKARIKSGKAAIPAYWRIEPPGLTVLVPGAAPKPVTAKGGTHASPRSHDRRGHPRTLQSGRTVWVKDCKINALSPHLTCDRTYYEIRLKKIVPPSLEGEDAKR